MVSSIELVYKRSLGVFTTIPGSLWKGFLLFHFRGLHVPATVSFFCLVEPRMTDLVRPSSADHREHYGGKRQKQVSSVRSLCRLPVFS